MPWNMPSKQNPLNGDTAIRDFISISKDTPKKPPKPPLPPRPPKRIREAQKQQREEQKAARMNKKSSSFPHSLNPKPHSLDVNAAAYHVDAAAAYPYHAAHVNAAYAVPTASYMGMGSYYHSSNYHGSDYHGSDMSTTCSTTFGSTTFGSTTLRSPSGTDVGDTIEGRMNGGTIVGKSGKTRFVGRSSNNTEQTRTRGLGSIGDAIASLNAGHSGGTTSKPQGGLEFTMQPAVYDSIDDNDFEDEVEEEDVAASLGLSVIKDSLTMVRKAVPEEKKGQKGGPLSPIREMNGVAGEERSSEERSSEERVDFVGGDFVEDYEQFYAPSSLASYAVPPVCYYPYGVPIVGSFGSMHDNMSNSMMSNSSGFVGTNSFNPGSRTSSHISSLRYSSFSSSLPSGRTRGRRGRKRAKPKEKSQDDTRHAEASLRAVAGPDSANRGFNPRLRRGTNEDAKDKR